MKYTKILLSIVTMVILFSGCQEEVTQSRTIIEVKIDATHIGDASMKLINMNNQDEIFDIPKASTYWIDLPNKYNIQLRTSDGVNQCYLLNGYKTELELYKKDIKIHCDKNLQFPNEIVLSPKHKVQIKSNSLSNWSAELFKIDNFNGVIGFASGQLFEDYLAGVRPLSRGFGLLAFEAPPVVTFSDLKGKITDQLLGFTNAIYAEASVEEIEISDEMLALGYNPQNMFNIGVSFETPLYIGSASLLNIISDYVLPVFKLPKPENFVTENFWDLKSQNYTLIISVLKDLTGDDYYIEVKFAGEEFEGYIDGATSYGTTTIVDDSFNIEDYI